LYYFWKLFGFRRLLASGFGCSFGGFGFGLGDVGGLIPLFFLAKDIKALRIQDPVTGKVI